ncbi:hypothetical protein [Curvibacter gracilis]|uniref:hypothetical protein n=1 Tax=Curvibacter gracilis TaxID=230310 RepID=UPI0012FCFCB3|nr:hypothetical protein [Curvibacter gracilis]
MNTSTPKPLAPVSVADADGLPAQAHEKWFQQQVKQALDLADDPATEWITQEQAQADWALQRAAIAAKPRLAMTESERLEHPGNSG